MHARQQRQDRRAERLALHDARVAGGRERAGLKRKRIWRRAVGDALLRTIGPWFLRALAATWRVTRVGKPAQQFLQQRPACVFVLWHGSMVIPLPVKPHRGSKLNVLVSPSNDGKLASLLLRHFGHRCIRGSASRSGATSLREMATALTSGGPVVITPDGPRGPRHTMNIGPAWLARGSGTPMITVAASVDRAWRLRSWDCFAIPKPFARVVLTYGDPRCVAADTDDEALEGISAELRGQLLAHEREGYAKLGVACDHDDR